MAPLFKLCLLFLAFSLAAMDCNCTSVKREISEVQEAPKDIEARVSCPEGQNLTSTQWGCFIAFENSKTWEDASTYCISKKLELASLHLVETRKQLIQLGKDVGLEEFGLYWVNLKRNPPTKEGKGDGLWRWGNKAQQQLKKDSLLWVTEDKEPNNGISDDRGWFWAGNGLMDNNKSMAPYFMCAVP